MEELLEIEPDQRDMTTKCNVYPWLNSKIKKKKKEKTINDIIGTTGEI